MEAAAQIWRGCWGGDSGSSLAGILGAARSVSQFIGSANNIFSGEGECQAGGHARPRSRRKWKIR